MAYSHFKNGFANGVTIRGIPLQQSQPGEVFFVGNSTVVASGGIGGSNGNKGTYQQPFSTIQYAKSLCVANRGDTIFVLPGHAETISSAAILTLDKAGVAIVGLGSGSLRPTLTFTAAAANIPITAANVSVTNILHIANFANVVSAYTATGTATPTDFCVENCEFRDTSSILNFVKTVTGNTTANSMDGFRYVSNNVFGLATAGGTEAVFIQAATSRCEYSDNFVVYPALNDTPALVDFSTNAQKNLIMARNKVYRPSTSTTAGSLFGGGSTTSTGYVYDNYSWHLDNSAALLCVTGTGLGFQNNFCMVTGAADKSGLINPAAV